MPNDRLFSDGELTEYLERLRSTALDAVLLVPPREILSAPDDVVDRLVSAWRVEPVTLDWDRRSRTEPREIQVTVAGFRDEPFNVPGQSLSIIVPLTGSTELLRRQANTFRVGPKPRGTVRDGVVVFSVADQNLTAEAVSTQVTHMQQELTAHIEWANAQVQAWEPQLRTEVSMAVQERRRRLEGMAQLSATLDIPLVATDNKNQLQVPVTRKTVRIDQQPDDRASRSTIAEYQMGDRVYEDVLRTVTAWGHALERLPRTARRFNEEELRDFLLFVLNTNYEGAARGEVFNGEGKTDLLLPYRGRNAFIGECKFWRGEKSFNEAIDQLMGYVVWRDTKAALILFIRRGAPTEIIAKADAAIRAHANFRNAEAVDDPSTRRDYVMASSDDPERRIHLAFLPVVVPEGERQPDALNPE